MPPCIHRLLLGNETQTYLANNKDVGKPGGKAVAIGIFHMNHIKRARMSLSVGDHTNSSQVSTSSHHTQVTGVKLDEVSYFACLQINLNGVIHLDEGIRVANSSSIMGHQMWDSFCAHKDLSHFAQFILGLLRCDTMNSKAALGVIDQAEVLSSFVNADHIHKSSRVGYVSPNFAINLNETLHADLLDFIASQGILKSVPQENDQRQTFPQLVRASGRTRSKHAGQFIQHPMFWSGNTLQMFLGTTSPLSFVLFPPKAKLSRFK